MKDAYLIWKWQQCERIAKKLSFRLETNSQDMISAWDGETITVNAYSVAELLGFLRGFAKAKGITDYD